MALSNKTLRTCENDHRYFKTSKCPVCPICESKRKPENGFLSILPSPARRALEINGIITLEKLKQQSKMISYDYMVLANLRCASCGHGCLKTRYHLKKIPRNCQIVDNSSSYESPHLFETIFF